MPVNCIHREAKRCAKGFGGGRPSDGWCNTICQHREPGASEPIPLTVDRVAHGAAGIAKALTGTGGASEGLVAFRSTLCGVCRHAKKIAGTVAKCELCGCLLWAKIRNAGESCPINKWGDATANNTDQAFAAAYVISLAKTPDRLRNFWLRFPAAWPFVWPQVFPAVDGSTLPTPAGGFAPNCNHGMLGCRQSWLNVLAKAIADNLTGPLLVMEDDCQFTYDAPQRIREAIAGVPDDWDILYLGGQHESPPTPVSPGLVRCLNTGRTHALVIHPRYFKPLFDFWTGYPNHVDWGLRQIAPGRKFYAVDPFVAVQGANVSTLRERAEPIRSWDGRVQVDVGTKADVVSHHGDLGDLIYGLPAMRATGARTLVLYPSPITRRRMTADVVDEIKPLLLAQSYIDEVRYADQPEGLDLSEWRLRHYRWTCNLADRQLDVVGSPHTERERPWIEVEPRRVARVVFHRSLRYQNSAMPWRRIMERYGADAVFVGLPNEHAAFSAAFGAVRHHPTADYLELARVIAGAELFIGNQSSPAALRFGMCKPIVLERVTGGWDNCHFDRGPNSTYIISGNEPLPDLHST